MEKFRELCNYYVHVSPALGVNARKYLISERVAFPANRKKKCRQLAVRRNNAGELAGSSFSRPGMAYLFVRFQVLGPPARCFGF
jgi:hypothetical protein